MTSKELKKANADRLAKFEETKDAAKQLDDVAKEYNLAKLEENGEGGFTVALKMATVMSKIRGLLTDEIMKTVDELQGSSLGFLTDKDAGQKYEIEVVKDCLIEAVIRGARPIGNEFNIISKRPYFTKQFFERIVYEYPDVSGMHITDGLKASDIKPGTTMDIPFKAKWLFKGEVQTLEGVVPVRVNQGMGADAILGKFRRKVLARVYQYISKDEHTLPDADIDDTDLPRRGVHSTTATPAGDLSAGRRSRRRPPQQPTEPEETTTGDTDGEELDGSEMISLDQYAIIDDAIKENKTSPGFVKKILAAFDAEDLYDIKVCDFDAVLTAIDNGAIPGVG